MKIYKISQEVNNNYDTYSEAIVIAKDEEEARKIHPNGEYNYAEHTSTNLYFGTWTKKIYVKVKYIGEAKKGSKKGVVCASFHAG